MSEILSPSRIQTARERRYLTKGELARELGVDIRTVTNYELMGAPSSRLSDLVYVLNFPEDFFIQSSTPDVSVENVEFRSKRSTRAKEKKAAVSITKLGIELVGWIEDRFSIPQPSLPDLAGMDPKIAATVLRGAWNLGTKPLPNLVQLCESHGIRVLGLPTDIQTIDAVSFWFRHTPYVFVSRLKTPERTRFNLAHELGHLVLHESSNIDSESEREKQADAFASEFLFPKIAQLEHTVLNPKLADIFNYKHAFGMSAMAVTYALHESGRLSDWNYRLLCKTLSQQGFRAGEPGSSMPFEQSRIFRVVLDSSIPDRSCSAIAKDLACPLDEVHSLTMNTEVHGVESSDLPKLPVSDTLAPVKLRLV